MEKSFHHKTSKGVEIVGLQMPMTRSCAIGTLVNTGSRDEATSESGLSHFLEHMLFKGTAKRNAFEVNQRFGDLGAQANAYTSNEHTLYYASVLTKYQSEYTELLSDMLRPSLRQEDFDMEKKVIIEEIALKSDDPVSDFFMQSVNTMFAGHPIGNLVLGTTQSVQDLTREQMLDYFERQYSTENLTFSIAGNFEWERFCNDVETLTADWTVSQKPSKRELRLPELKAADQDFFRKDLNLAQIFTAHASVSAQSADRYAAALYSSLIGDASGSKLYWALMEPGIAESLYCWSDQLDQAGVQYYFAGCLPENVDRLKEILASIPALAEEITSAQLKITQEKLSSKIAIGAERPYGRMVGIAEDWVYRNEIDSIRNVIDSVRSVTLEEIRSYGEKINFDQRITYSLLPEQ